MQQSARDRVMQAFREDKIRILVATDVVGRGIDVSNISHIINYDLPQFCDDYVHRVGRTGRMGREGVAYSFVMPEEGNELTRIEIRINRLLKRDDIPGYDPLVSPNGSSRLPKLDQDDSDSPAAASTEATADEPARPKVPPPPGKRMPKRYRRGL
jgi:ATP-dependent RNA helicase DeaD